MKKYIEIRGIIGMPEGKDQDVFVEELVGFLKNKRCKMGGYLKDISDVDGRHNDIMCNDEFITKMLAHYRFGGRNAKNYK
ncbi:hypothetical protein [Eubacterium barkeri]|uniref:Uncharacterized protein n=1 Tax=Eubacterium barkeri TaxID=1528 RepID=A0A1H3BHX4_EUBBA|nr:hypothetical protein [Eubacterium barkeri]SDX41572.1 hypothetical protein SAMN04488579_10288 [Eubacterium barkeri]